MPDPQPSFKLGLAGYPLAHSISPALHHAALRAARLTGRYDLFPVPRLPGGEAQLTGLLGRIRGGELQGINLTIPHKEAVIPLLDRLTPDARAIGAINTVFMKEGCLTGHNTDAEGFRRDLQRAFSASPGAALLLGAGGGAGAEGCALILGAGGGAGAEGCALILGAGGGAGTEGCALILGAGGGARAAAYALSAGGWRVHLAARRPAQAEKLAADLGLQGTTIIPLPLEGRAVRGLEPDLIVNATPQGMFPDSGGCPWPAAVPFPPHSKVYDLVYNPRETRLLQLASLAGLEAAGGIGMLIEQAALAFEIWTGAAAPRAAMRAAAASD